MDGKSLCLSFSLSVTLSFKQMNKSLKRNKRTKVELFLREELNLRVYMDQIFLICSSSKDHVRTIVGETGSYINERSQAQKNYHSCHSCVHSKKAALVSTEGELPPDMKGGGRWE